MVEERKIILDLLDINRITKEEAFKLLEALDKSQKSHSKFNFDRELHKLGKSADRLIKDISDKYKKYEPNINEVAKKTKDSAINLFNNVSGKIKKEKPKENDIFEHDDFVDKNK